MIYIHCNLIKIPASNFVYVGELILKYIWRGKGEYWIPHTILKENKVERSALSDFKASYKATKIMLVCFLVKEYSVEKNRNLKNRPAKYSQKFFLRERESEWVHAHGGGQCCRGRRGEKILIRLHTVSMEPEVGLDLTTMRSWPEPKSRVGHLTDWATQVPQSSDFWQRSRGNIVDQR